ncbi:McrB family protein [Macrococcoides caseolyticum]|uniref:McrB family protein n=1 Tax=Macrococcoides caseolyticum TaxID=69966 RepID=UPI001E5F3665|nr:AAA family ATPase [Macrococcus caseolyticus]
MREDKLINYLLENLEGTFRNRQSNYNAISLRDHNDNIRNIFEISYIKSKDSICVRFSPKELSEELLSKYDTVHTEYDWSLSDYILIKEDDDYEKYMELLFTCYKNLKEEMEIKQAKKLSEQNEKKFKSWIKEYKKHKEKSENAWLAVDAKIIWLKGEKVDIDFIEIMPIKELFLKIDSLSEQERLDLEKLPNNLMSLPEDKFMEVKHMLDDISVNHEEELRKAIEATNLDNSQNASYSTFKPTNFAKEYLMALQEQEFPDDKNRTEEQDVKPFSSYASKLISSKNIIFRGAPGTGKTYLARQIASEIVSNKRTKNYSELTKDEKERIGFVQFHPNYDYTDFVEGYRPVMSDSNNEQMGFELIDGVFKKFVINAKKSQFSGGVDNFDEAWAKFFEKVNIDNVNEDTTYNMNTLTGKPMHLVQYVRNGIEGVWEEGTDGQFYNKEQCYKVYQGKPGVPKGGFDNYRKAIVQHLKDEYGLLDFVPKEDKNLGESFVFIIDEINRGEMSKIFGELFFSIDPGYRGKKGTVQTQYSAVQNPDDAEFYVPENVYIIGTMNDIDRSVESFDFAMRRRFRFIEIKADDERQLKMLEQLEDYETVKARLLSLNNYIGNVDGLNSHYHVGPSYFLKLKDLNYDYELLWSDYIAPLLEEYIRGFYNEEELMESLKLAYDLKDEFGED